MGILRSFVIVNSYTVKNVWLAQNQMFQCLMLLFLFCIICEFLWTGHKCLYEFFEWKTFLKFGGIIDWTQVDKGILKY
jgi:hypothetical protein